MKKILSIALVALTLCVQHESHAIGNLRNYAGRFGQQCQLLYNQGAQRVAPAYRTLTTGLGQRVSNIRPQTSQWFRNMQSSARNWSQNLNLPTARTTALGLGAGLTTAAYLQRPDIFDVAGAEEEVPTPEKIIKHVDTQITYSCAPLEGPAGPVGEPSAISNMLDTIRSSSKPFASFVQLKTIAQNFRHEMTVEDRKNFAPIVNNILNGINREPVLREMLFQALPYSPEEAVNAKFNIHDFENIILGDILLANGAYTYDDIQSNQNIEIPTVYKKFFRGIGQDDAFGPALKNTLDEIKKNEAYKNNPNFHRIFDEILKESQKSSSSWWQWRPWS